MLPTCRPLLPHLRRPNAPVTRLLRSVGLVLLAGGIAAGPAAGQQTPPPPLPSPSDNTPQYPSNPMPIAEPQGLDKITEIGRTTCRERVCQYGYVQVVAVSFKKKKRNKNT